MDFKLWKGPEYVGLLSLWPHGTFSSSILLTKMDCIFSRVILQLRCQLLICLLLVAVVEGHLRLSGTFPCHGLAAPEEQSSEAWFLSSVTRS